MPQLQRLLFSATLTDNPQKLAQLGVHNPEIVRMLSEGGQAASEAAMANAAATAFSVPATLVESTVVCETARRPLLLATILVESAGPEAGAEAGAGAGAGPEAGAG